MKKDLFTKHTLAITTFSLLILVASFLVLTQQKTQRLAGILKAQLNQSDFASNPYRFSQFIEIVERAESVICSELINTKHQSVYFSNSFKDTCKNRELLSIHIDFSMNFSAISGSTWTYKAIIVVHLTSILLLALISATVWILAHAVILISNNEAYKSLLELEAQMAISDAFVQLARQVAHDIRSPITALEAAIGLPTEKIHQSRDLLIATSQRISQIADDLLEKTRISNELPTIKKTTPTKMSANVSQCVNTILEHKRLSYREIKFLFENREPNLILKIDEFTLERILDILLNNSIQAMTSTLEKRIEIVTQTQGGEGIIQINDTGIGFPEQLQSKVGNLNFSFGKKSGNGLGIHYCVTKLKEVAGSFRIQKNLSTPGTLAIVRIPRA